MVRDSRGTGPDRCVSRPAPEGTLCKDRPVGTSCWVELANQPGSYAWNSYFQPGETVTWTSECAEGLAQGTGTLTEVWDEGEKTKEKTGTLVDGKAQGRWIYRDQDGNIAEGSYEESQRQGWWVMRKKGLVVDRTYFVRKYAGEGNSIRQNPTERHHQTFARYEFQVRLTRGRSSLPAVLS